MKKLVRDRIPHLIAVREGSYPTTFAVTGFEHLNYLIAKLREETDEFEASPTIEELADILEVVYALAHSDGYSREDLVNVARGKRIARGGFDDGVILVQDPSPADE